MSGAAALVEVVVALPDGRDVRLLRPPDAEALLDERAFDHEEFLPYWAELWPSAEALARALAPRALRGARTLELGCGLGLPSIAAALAGGRVLATDWAPDALAATARNAARNGARVEVAPLSWFAPAGAALDRAPWDLVLAADVLYERRNLPALLALLPRLVGTRGEVWLADPGRRLAEDFLRDAAERFAIHSIRDPRRSMVQVHRLRFRAA